MNIVDSSAWLEFFAGTKHGERFARIVENAKLLLADSIILAASEKYSATLWTLDADFKGLPRVKYFAKSD